MTTVPSFWWRGLNPESHTWDTVGELAPHWEPALLLFQISTVWKPGVRGRLMWFGKAFLRDLYFTNQFSLSHMVSLSRHKRGAEHNLPTFRRETLCFGCSFPNSHCRGSAISFPAFMKACLIEITPNAHPTSVLRPQGHFLFRNSLTSSLLGF